MEKKIKAGIIGATGMVGQKFLTLLKGHPWFDVVYLAASPQSAGKRYAEVVAGRWHMDEEIPPRFRDMTVGNASDVAQAAGKCRVVFSAVEMDKQAIMALEMEYASRGLIVVSNNSAHRQTVDVPVIIPEINPEHLEIIPAQQRHYGWDKGFIVVKPNCSIQSYMLPVYALMKAGYTIDRMIVSTLQAVSGAGYPGPASIDLIDNIIPYIPGEEEKSENEPKKIFGRIRDGRFELNENIRISAHCNRVPATDGHLACVSIGFAGKKPEMAEVVRLWRDFSGLPQELKLPSAPVPPIVYRDEVNRPQPRKDRHAGGGMAVTVGRLRPCPVFDYRFVGLHHNTVRGAAGGAILTAELLVARGLVA